jgi:3-deoxy-D-manno-octulosonate 8-phosphate phosphatase KdsC-like HAD superfamily phosphatase
MPNSLIVMERVKVLAGTAKNSKAQISLANYVKQIKGGAGSQRNVRGRSSTRHGL